MNGSGPARAGNALKHKGLENELRCGGGICLLASARQRGVRLFQKHYVHDKTPQATVNAAKERELMCLYVMGDYQPPPGKRLQAVKDHAKYSLRHDMDAIKEVAQQLGMPLGWPL